jgi:hypothetical protein
MRARRLCLGKMRGDDATGTEVSDAAKPRWIWERTDAEAERIVGRRGQALKNEGNQATRCVYAGRATTRGNPEWHAEVIQNSWDAARELRGETWGGGAGFEIEFTFRDLMGKTGPTPH